MTVWTWLIDKNGAHKNDEDDQLRICMCAYWQTNEQTDSNFISKDNCFIYWGDKLD